MNILFIHISKNWKGRVYQEYPLGIGIVATIADQAGYNVNILDLAVDSTPLKTVLKKTKPDIVALSFLSTSASSAALVINEVLSHGCSYIISGGIHTSIFPEHVLSLGVDIAVVGEGEISIISLLKTLEKSKTKTKIIECLKNIPNLVFNDEFGKTIHTKKAIDSVKIDEVPPVNRELFNLDLYQHHSIITSRGCPYKCKFCCAWGPGGRKGRMASPNRIINELEMLVSKYGAITIYWADDMFFFNKRQRLRFCSLLKERNLPIKWIAQLRADNLDAELVSALVTSGCEKICLGAESGSDAILKSIDKGLTRDSIKRGIHAAKSGGLTVKTWWIVGLPNSSVEEQLKSLDLIDETRPHEVAVHTFVPLPGTVYWDNASDFGIHLPRMDSLEKLYYYGNSGDIQFDYLSQGDMTSILNEYDARLQKMGYVSTDKANPNSKYTYTSPLQTTTFKI